MSELIDKQQAIDAFETAAKGGASIEDIKLILAEMPSAQPERKGHGCEFCCEDIDCYVLAIEKNGHAYIQNGKLALRVKGWRGECGINYCPMCGAKMEGERKE